MRAIVVRRFGPFDEARYETLDEPVPGRGEVVVDIEASEVNFPDILLVEGSYQRRPPLPFSPGTGGAGTVTLVGTEVETVDVGDRVLVLPDYGTYAERLLTSAGHCLPIPDEMPFEVAASLGLSYQTACLALTERGGLRTGNSVLVLGASGGVGMAAIQLAKALGASCVIAATRGAEGAAFVSSCGADVVVDTGMENLRDGLREKVLAATGGRGADVVVDTVGGETSGAALRAVAWSGRFVVVGFASGTIPSFPANYLLVKNIAVAGLQWTDYREREPNAVRRAQSLIFMLWAQGRIRPIISRTLPMHRYGEALASLKAGRSAGKTILTNSPRDH